MSFADEVLRSNQTPSGMQGALLINKQRTWKSFGISDAYQPDPSTKTPKGKLGTFYPNGLWIVQVWGERSDGTRCQITLNVDGRWFSQPERFWKVLQKSFIELETFRNCDCTGPDRVKGIPGRLCQFHGTAAQKGMETQMTAGGATVDTSVPAEPSGG